RRRSAYPHPRPRLLRHRNHRHRIHRPARRLIRRRLAHRRADSGHTPPPPPPPPSPPAPPHVSSGVNECGTLLNRTTRVSHSLVPSRCERGRYGGNVPLWGRRGGEGRGPVCLRHRSKGIQAGGDAFAGSLTRVATHST